MNSRYLFSCLFLCGCAFLGAKDPMRVHFSFEPDGSATGIGINFSKTKKVDSIFMYDSNNTEVWKFTSSAFTVFEGEPIYFYCGKLIRGHEYLIKAYVQNEVTAVKIKAQRAQVEKH